MADLDAGTFSCMRAGAQLDLTILKMRDRAAIMEELMNRSVCHKYIDLYTTNAGLIKMTPDEARAHIRELAEQALDAVLDEAR